MARARGRKEESGQDTSEIANKTNNLAAARPGMVSDLRAELEMWRKEVRAEMMRPNPDYDPNVELPAKKKRTKGVQ